MKSGELDRELYFSHNWPTERRRTLGHRLFEPLRAAARPARALLYARRQRWLRASSAVVVADDDEVEGDKNNNNGSEGKSDGGSDKSGSSTTSKQAKPVLERQVSPSWRPWGTRTRGRRRRCPAAHPPRGTAAGGGGAKDLKKALVDQSAVLGEAEPKFVRQHFSRDVQISRGLSFGGFGGGGGRGRHVAPGSAARRQQRSAAVPSLPRRRTMRTTGEPRRGRCSRRFRRRTRR